MPPAATVTPCIGWPVVRSLTVPVTRTNAQLASAAAWNTPCSRSVTALRLARIPDQVARRDFLVEELELKGDVERRLHVRGGQVGRLDRADHAVHRLRIGF